MTPQIATKIELVTPFPEAHFPLVREWMEQYPDRTMDDFWFRGYQAPELFAAEMTRRGEQEYTCCVLQDGVPVGFIGYTDMSPHVGTLRGVCFDRAVHGNGTALRALRTVLQRQFDRGVHKIMAFPFLDNLRARAFYKKLGAVPEGVLRDHTRRGGALVDMDMLAFFAKADGYLMAHDQVRTDH